MLGKSIGKGVRNESGPVGLGIFRLHITVKACGGTLVELCELSLCSPLTTDRRPAGVGLQFLFYTQLRFVGEDSRQQANLMNTHRPGFQLEKTTADTPITPPPPATMRTSAVSDNVLFIALTTHILHSYRRSLTMRDPTLYAPYTPTSPYTPGDHAAAAALLRTCHIQDVLADDFDILARDILPPDYASRLRGAARGSGAGYVPLSGEDAMSVQVYGAYRRAKKELLECVAGAVDGQRDVMQGEMDAMVVAYRGVGRLGWDERRGRVVFLEATGGRWVEMFA